MSEIELTSLHAEIEAFLRGAAGPRRAPAAHEDWSFWRERPIIAAAEMEMLAWLADNPAAAAAIACRLDRDEPATRALLDGLIGIGLVARDGDRYNVTAATRLYLRTHLDM